MTYIFYPNLPDEEMRKVREIQKDLYAIAAKEYDTRVIVMIMDDEVKDMIRKEAQALYGESIKKMVQSMAPDIKAYVKDWVTENLDRLLDYDWEG